MHFSIENVHVVNEYIIFMFLNLLTKSTIVSNVEELSQM